MHKMSLFRADPSTHPSGGGLTRRVYTRLCGEYKRQRGARLLTQKSRGKNSSEEARLRLVGSLRRTARAWSFSHHENPLAKPGCPSSIGAVAAARKNISYTYTHTPRDYVPASGESSAAFRTSAERKEQRSASQVNHQKFCRHRTRRPFGKTNRLSIIDGGKCKRRRHTNQPGRLSQSST